MERTLVTAEELERMGSRGEHLELFRGVIRERQPMGARHGEVTVEVLTELHGHVRGNNLGRVYPALTHFVLARNPDTVLKFDGAVVLADRLPPISEREGMMQGAPNLAVEVISPDDLYVEVMERVGLYLETGVALVWLIEPKRQVATVFSGRFEQRIVTADGALDGGDVLPGFSLPLALVFR